MKSTSEPETRPPSGPSIFIAAHVAVVMLLYGVALVAGGGFASPPFPPDAPASRSTTVSARAVHADTELVADQTALAQAAGNDIAPPWTFDGEGRARFTER